jgi:hypothetical protein
MRMDDPNPGEQQKEKALSRHAAHEFYPWWPPLRKGTEEDVDRSLRHNTGPMCNCRGTLLSVKTRRKCQDSWPYRKRQELVKKWFGRESPLTVLSEGKPKPGLVKQLLTLIARLRIILSKAATRKTRICILLLTIAHSGNDQQTGIWGPAGWTSSLFSSAQH